MQCGICVFADKKYFAAYAPILGTYCSVLIINILYKTCFTGDFLEMRKCHFGFVKVFVSGAQCTTMGRWKCLFSVAKVILLHVDGHTVVAPCRCCCWSKALFAPAATSISAFFFEVFYSTNLLFTENMQHVVNMPCQSKAGQEKNSATRAYNQNASFFTETGILDQ